MLLEYAEASFECMEHRFRQLRGLACVKRVLQEYALANDVGLQFGDVPVGLVKMLLFPSAIHGFAPTARHSSGLNRRTAVGRAPAQANRIGPGPYGLGTCVRQGPAARSSAVQNLGPVSIKFRLLTARLFINAKHTEHFLDILFGLFAGKRPTPPAGGRMRLGGDGCSYKLSLGDIRKM